ncbi:MAG: hypothetical protein IJV35_07465 [Neisseriaceae bacterium]|nr:hypothetical protein [Neisseriaceae bacterium]
MGRLPTTTPTALLLNGFRLPENICVNRSVRYGGLETHPTKLLSLRAIATQWRGNPLTMKNAPNDYRRRVGF